MMKSIEIDTALTNQWLSDKLNVQEAEGRLSALGYDSDIHEAYLAAYKKLRNEKRQRIGFLFMGIGSFLGFLSCVLTMIDIMPAFNNFFLYGLTSLAVAMVFVGLFFVFE